MPAGVQSRRLGRHCRPMHLNAKPKVCLRTGGTTGGGNRRVGTTNAGVGTTAVRPSVASVASIHNLIQRPLRGGEAAAAAAAAAATAVQHVQDGSRMPRGWRVPLELEHQQVRKAPPPAAAAAAAAIATAPSVRQRAHMRAERAERHSTHGLAVVELVCATQRRQHYAGHDARTYGTHGTYGTQYAVPQIRLVAVIRALLCSAIYLHLRTCNVRGGMGVYGQCRAVPCSQTMAAVLKVGRSFR